MRSSLNSKKLFEEISKLSTEQRNPHSMDIDAKSTAEIIKIINDEDKLVPYAVEQELPYIEQAVEIIVKALKSGGQTFILWCWYKRPIGCGRCIRMSTNFWNTLRND